MNVSWWPPQPFVLLHTLQRDEQTGLRLLGPYFLCKGVIAQGTVARVKQAIHRSSQKRFTVKCYRLSSLLNKNVRRLIDSFHVPNVTSALDDIYEGIRVMRQIKETSDFCRCEDLHDVFLVLNKEKEQLNKSFRAGFFAKLYLGCVMMRYDSLGLNVNLTKTEKNTLKKQFVSLHHAYEQSLIRHTQDSNEYSEEIVKCFAKDIATAITFLHNQDIVHWDIKPENILMERNGRVKLGDFSVAARVHFRKRKNYGTYAFSSPELCETSDDNSHTTDLDPKACDMWALGVTIFLLFKGSIPYYTKNPQEFLHNVCHYSLDMTHLTGLSDPLKTCLVSLLCKNPKNRLKASDFLNHEWLKNVDYACSKEYAERLLQFKTSN